MDAARQSRRDPAEDRLNLLARTLANKRQPRRQGPLGVAPPHRHQADACLIKQPVFPAVVGIARIGKERCARGKVQRQTVHACHISYRSRQQDCLNRLPAGGDDQMQAQAVEIAPLAGNVASEDLAMLTTWVQAAAPGGYKRLRQMRMLSHTSTGMLSTR